MSRAGQHVDSLFRQRRHFAYGLPSLLCLANAKVSLYFHQRFRNSDPLRDRFDLMRFTELLNLDEMPTFSKQEVALHQLERALHLFLDENDYVCAITLAGASEEILGKLLEKSGKQPALGSFVETCVAAGKSIHGEEWPPKLFVSMANAFRDSLKHYTDGQAVTVPREAAVEILDRAIDNYWLLTGDQAPLMRRFMKEVHGW